MAQAEATTAPPSTPEPPRETLEARFLTWHDSAGNLHVRTDSLVLFIDKTKEDVQEVARRLRRHQRLRAVGTTGYSKTLSNTVFEVDTLEAL